MDSSDALVVRVRAVEGEEDGDLLEVTALLRQELLDLDVDEVGTVETEEAPADAKGVAALAGWLAVQLGSVETVRAVIDALRGWAGRRRREVEVTIGGDTLKLSAVSASEQEHIIDAWLARHAAGS
jgi:hypothetical protein